MLSLFFAFFGFVTGLFTMWAIMYYNDLTEL